MVAKSPNEYGSAAKMVRVEVNVAAAIFQLIFTLFILVRYCEPLGKLFLFHCSSRSDLTIAVVAACSWIVAFRWVT